MNADDLTHNQCQKMRDALFPLANYVVRMKKRMEKLGFPRRDPLYALVAASQEDLQRLSMELHYRSCKSGVARGGSPLLPNPSFETTTEKPQ